MYTSNIEMDWIEISFRFNSGKLMVYVMIICWIAQVACSSDKFPFDEVPHMAVLLLSKLNLNFPQSN